MAWLRFEPLEHFKTNGQASLAHYLRNKPNNSHAHWDFLPQAIALELKHT